MPDGIIAIGTCFNPRIIMPFRFEDRGDWIERPQCQGLVGPKIATVGVPIAADMCINPESLVTARSAAASASIALRTSLLVRSRTRLSEPCTIFSPGRFVRPTKHPYGGAIFRESRRQCGIVAHRPCFADANRAWR